MTLDDILSEGFRLDHLGQPLNRPGQWCCVLERDGELYRGFAPTWPEAIGEAMSDPTPTAPIYAHDLDRELVYITGPSASPDLASILAGLRKPSPIVTRRL